MPERHFLKALLSARRAADRSLARWPLTLTLALALALICFVRAPKVPWVSAIDWSAGEPFVRAEWKFERGFLRNAEAQYYAGDSPDNFQVTPEGLKLIGRAERSNTAPKYTSASIVSVRAWQNVKVEVIASFRGGKGSWPAIWLRGKNIRGFSEVDIMEHLGREPNTVHTTIHLGASLASRYANTAHRDIPVFDGADIAYAAELTPKKVTVAVNGVRMLSLDRNITIAGRQPLQQPFNLVLNLALGGAWSGTIDDGALPAVLTIRSIKILELIPDTSPDVVSP